MNCGIYDNLKIWWRLIGPGKAQNNNNIGEFSVGQNGLGGQPVNPTKYRGI